jgi:hypothetical protein
MIRLYVQFLVELGLPERRGAADGDEDDRPSPTLTAPVIEEVHESLGLQSIQLGGSRLERTT